MASAGLAKAGRSTLRHRRSLAQMPASQLAGQRVIVAGLFSANLAQYEWFMNELTRTVKSHGALVVAMFVQRRGASDCGVRRMHDPYSRRTLMTMVKIREIAAASEALEATAGVFHNPVTEQQRAVLSRLLGCPVLGMPTHVWPPI
jgi:50S ribosomal subunit-associated GTPase HflX